MIYWVHKLNFISSLKGMAGGVNFASTQLKQIQTDDPVNKTDKLNRCRIEIEE